MHQLTVCSSLITSLMSVGCLNGAGQIKPQPGQSGKELIQLLETAYVENVSHMFDRVCHNITILDSRNFLSSLKALRIICGMSGNVQCATWIAELGRFISDYCSSQR